MHFVIGVFKAVILRKLLDQPLDVHVPGIMQIIDKHNAILAYQGPHQRHVAAATIYGMVAIDKAYVELPFDRWQHGL
jgi:hypothetical protein